MSFRFKKAWRGPVLSRDQGLRQGQAVKSALAMLGQSEARAFLNAHHAGLGGRPLDLAVASEAGLSAVETALCVEGQRAGANC
jgi:hypothetical protein